MNGLTNIEKSTIRTNLPEISAGDTIRVYQKIKEGDKERLAPFEGLVIATKHGHGPSATFTVRKVVDGIGVERVFPIHLPTISKIDIISKAKVKKAKLYYIREKAAREVRKKMKNIRVETVREVPAKEEAIEDKAGE